MLFSCASGESAQGNNLSRFGGYSKYLGTANYKTSKQNWRSTYEPPLSKNIIPVIPELQRMSTKRADLRFYTSSRM